MSRLSYARGLCGLAGALTSGVLILAGSTVPSATADVRVATGLRVEVVVTGISRPIQLAFDPSGGLVVLSHGRGDAAGELYRFDLAGLPLDASRAPRVVIPFSEGPRKSTFGSLAVDPRSGDLFLGEENGNRVYRLTADRRLLPFAVGLHHLVGGGSLAFDGKGRLVVLDFASPETQVRAEGPPPLPIDWLAAGTSQMPLVFRVDPTEEIPQPRRLNLVSPLFPRLSAPQAAGEFLPRFVSVGVSPTDELLLLGSQGEVFRLAPEGALQRLARLPAGHYHRTNMTLAPDGGVFVSAGFHLRDLFRVSPAGAVTRVAWELGDPGGLVVDRLGRLYVAETALHRIIRISPSP